MKPTKSIWKNGELIPWENAQTHVLTHGLHYGTGFFEGIRAYNTNKGPAIFRAKEHYERLHHSCHIYNAKAPYSVDELISATQLLLKDNNLTSCYIRPLIYYGYGEMGLNPRGNKLETIIAAWEWGSYLGEEGLEKGIRVMISSWNRLDARIMPPHAKCAANYANSALAKMEALDAGYDEALLLNINGTVAEGPGENLFLIKNNHLYSVPASDNALPGITADAIKQIAQKLNIPFTYRSIIRDELFTADELFFTGTAAEVTPIREINGRTIGSGKRGPITEQLQSAFFDIVKGKSEDSFNWLTY